MKNLQLKRFFIYIKEYLIAMRILSLTLALATTSFGIIAAYRMDEVFKENAIYSIFLIALITIAGLLSQLGANLINDYFEGSFKYRDYSAKNRKFLGKERSYFDIFVFLSGIAALGAACLIGLYLVYITDIYMLVIGIIGIIGSYAYTGEPFVYKTKGLGVPLSFVLMGPLMIFGAFYPFVQAFQWYPILLGLPVSLFVPAMMISNEMRDFSRDERLSIGTLSVILGSKRSLLLYDILVFGAFLLTIAYVLLGLYPVQTLFSLVLIPLAVKAHNCVKRFERLSIPYTNQIHLYYFLIVGVYLIFW
jgi:1,4-dihydroxy-2-naphthoate octaprenyltransferase